MLTLFTSWYFSKILNLTKWYFSSACQSHTFWPSSKSISEICYVTYLSTLFKGSQNLRIKSLIVTYDYLCWFIKKQLMTLLIFFLALLSTSSSLSFNIIPFFINKYFYFKKSPNYPIHTHTWRHFFVLNKVMSEHAHNYGYSLRVQYIS